MKKTLYFDLDGVLVDLQYGLKQAFNLSIEEIINIYGLPECRKLIQTRSASFWAELPWINGGKEIFDFAEKLWAFDIHILSSAGTIDPLKAVQAIEGKTQWLRNNLPQIKQENIHIVLGRIAKQKLVQKDAILIDDMADTISLWNINGGIGVLHKSEDFQSTINAIGRLANN